MCLHQNHLRVMLLSTYMVIALGRQLVTSFNIESDEILLPQYQIA